MNRLMSSDFNKNVLKLMTGTTIAQAIPVAISPILTRFYSPEDFGVLALFIAISAIFGSIATGRYELAIVLPEKEEDSINLVALSVLISFLLSFFLLIVILLFQNSIVSLLDNSEIGFWLYFIPVVVFSIGIYNALNYLNTRMKTFGVIAQVNVVKQLTLAVLQLALGFLKVGVVGLITGQIASHIFANGKLAKNILGNKELLSKIRLKEIVRLGKRYSDFPKYSVWSIFANSLSLNLTNIFISSIYSSASLGFYSLVQRILSLPANVLGNSIGQVFFQKATEEKNKYGNSKNTFRSTSIKLLVISIPSFTLLFFIVEDLIAFVFGEEWSIAGEYAKIILPLTMIRFITTPLSTTNSIFEQQKISLIWQIVLLLLSIVIFVISYLFSLPIKDFLMLLTIFLSVHYIILFVIVYKVSTGSR